ncbi:hypothetical protein OG698_28375 [Streptomyces sp. NBC_01003]|uniref:hypothetical protein n=1 Tax=Streptomyces sp. NBC_01003 TaxID=2903714 RepID=UPI00386446C4|nr:hypothetical protein OG698_28375 [Streptomyces sp. NBC_01003]
MAGTGPGQSDASTGMQLNQIPADPSSTTGPPGPTFYGPPSGQQNLVSSPAQKKAAAKAIEDHIEPDTKKAGDYSDEETSGVVKAFDAKDGHGWLMSSSLKKAHKTWGEQVQTLMNRLGSEKASLRSTNILLTNKDFGVRSGVQGVPTPSAFDRY